MVAATKAPAESQPTLETYLGFEIHRFGEGSYVAIPRGWMREDAAVLEAPDRPALRKRIWSWWHRLLD